MNAAVKIGLASALAMATALPVIAQPYQPTAQYQADMEKYQRDRAAYDANRADYAADRADYREARAAYDRRRADWEAARANYDARYGYGSYTRVYGPEPAWDEARWNSAPNPVANDTRANYRAARAAYDRRRADWDAARADYDARYGYGAYVRAYGAAPVWDEATWRNPPPAAIYQGRDTAYTTTVTCKSNNNATVTAGIIGALAGAALGSNVAAGGVRTEGAVLGAIVGGGIGAAVGNANDRYKCDTKGPYYSYNETIPYREARDFRSGRYTQNRYSQMRCRLAAAPIDTYGQDVRYVRVCPDTRGRYRITG